MEPADLREKVFESLTKYDDLTLLEVYSVFMAKSQILELALKRTLEGKAGLTTEDTEKFTLGRTINDLGNLNMHPQFIFLLRELLDYRNDIAHNFLADNAIGNNLVGSEYDRLSAKTLRYALYKVQEATLVYDYLHENNYLFY